MVFGKKVAPALWIAALAALLPPLTVPRSAASLERVITELSLRSLLDGPRTGAPVTWGVPLGIDEAVTDVSALRLEREGLVLPAQFTPLARWGGAPGDGTKPVMWLLVDTAVDLAPAEELRIALVREAPPPGASPLRVLRDDAAGVAVDTGAAVYELSRTAFRLFDRVTLEGGAEYGGGGGVYHKAGGGGAGGFAVHPALIEVEQSGPQRISLLVRGAVAGALRFSLRLHFYRGLAEVKGDFRLENLNAPAVSGGQPRANDYGSPGAVSVDDLSLVFPAAGEDRYCLPLGELGAGGEECGAFGSAVSVVQESSGGADWDYYLRPPRQLSPRLQSGVTKRLSTVTVDGAAADGPARIGGWIEASGLAVALERPWQNFPKALRAGGGALSVGLFPGEFSRDHELRAGEFKTHTFWVRHGGAPGSAGRRARSFASPLRLLRPAAETAASEAAGLFAPPAEGEFAPFELGTRYQVSPSPQWRGEYPYRTVLEAREGTDSFGWVDYGDIPTDFEVESSPYNLKYDGLRGSVFQALRNGTEERWWELAAAGARHAGDVDVQHSTVRGYASPRAWYEGGMYGHGYHDEPGYLNPHRNYMNPASSMAGPAPGITLWALLTGDTLLLESGIELADNLYWRAVNSLYNGDAPDGDPWNGAVAACAVDAGLRRCGGSCEGYGAADLHRSGGNIVQAMLYAHRATGNAAYLELVEQIADFLECVYPAVLPLPCDRFHIRTPFFQGLAHYLFYRERLGLPADGEGLALLGRIADFIAAELYAPATGEFRTCYESPPYVFHDNWLFGYAGALGAAGLLLERPGLIEEYGLAAFEDGSRNQFYEGSALSYHSAKEYVNQVGLGNLFPYLWQRRGDVPGDDPVPDLRGNGEDGPLLLGRGSPLSVTLALEAGTEAGRECDWFVLWMTPFPQPWRWLHYDFAGGWSLLPLVSRQAPLEDVPALEILNSPSLPAGSYRFLFLLDAEVDGRPGPGWADQLFVTVER